MLRSESKDMLKNPGNSGFYSVLFGVPTPYKQLPAGAEALRPGAPRKFRNAKAEIITPAQISSKFAGSLPKGLEQRLPSPMQDVEQIVTKKGKNLEEALETSGSGT